MSVAPGFSHSQNTEKTPIVPEERGRKKYMWIKLATNDGKIIRMRQELAFKSGVLRNMLQNLGINEPGDKRLDEPLPASCIDCKTLAKIMVYCVQTKDIVWKPKSTDEDPRIELEPWENEYLDVPAEELIALMMGALYLDIPGIIDIATQKIANMASGKTPEEMRQVYELPNDFTPEEEVKIEERYKFLSQPSATPKAGMSPSFRR